jgi:O-antigen/teichoic acid export membrane protein
VVLSVLGRLLTPADFGVVAIAMTITLIVEVVSELPIIQALLRLPTITRAHLDTAFTLGFIRGLVIALMMGAIAWPAVHFYNDPRLFWLITALAVAPAARGLGNPRLAEFAKRLDFRRDLFVDVFGKLVSLLLAIGVAISTHSYWAIAIGTIATGLGGTLFSDVLAPYRPRLGLSEWGQFSSFFRWSSAAQIIGAFNWQMDQLLLGKFVGHGAELGQFSMASNLALLPLQLLILQSVRPLVAAFSLVRDDPKRLAGAYRSSSYAVAAVGIPVLVGLSAIAAPMIEVLLGAKWLPAANSLSRLSVAALSSMLIAPASPLAMCLGKTSVIFRINVIEFAFKLPLMTVGAMMYGVPGVLAVRVIVNYIVSLAMMFSVRGLIGVSVASQLANPWRPVVGGILMAGAAFGIQAWLGGIHVSGAVELAAILAGSIVVYSGSVLALWELAGRPPGFEAKLVNLVRSSALRFAAARKVVGP